MLWTEVLRPAPTRRLFFESTELSAAWKNLSNVIAPFVTQWSTAYCTCYDCKDAPPPGAAFVRWLHLLCRTYRYWGILGGCVTDLDWEALMLLLYGWSLVFPQMVLVKSLGSAVYLGKLVPHCLHPRVQLWHVDTACLDLRETPVKARHGWKFWLRNTNVAVRWSPCISDAQPCCDPLILRHLRLLFLTPQAIHGSRTSQLECNFLYVTAAHVSIENQSPIY